MKIIEIKIHSNSSQEKIIKKNEDEYEIWIKEKHIENKANLEICKILKKYFKAKEVKIKSGFTSKIKKIEVI